MTYATQRDALVRTQQDLLVIGVRECQNAYAALVPELLQYTEQIDNAAWTKTSVTVTANNATAPDGTATADTCVFNADNDAIDQVATGTAVTSKAFTLSVWLRLNSGSSTISLRVRNVADTQGTTKQVTVTTTWTRFYVHCLFTGVPVDDVQARLIRLAGDTINGNIQVWGFNLTQNRSAVNMESPFPYVKRETAAVNASTCSISDNGDGARCHYSRPTCQDKDNFNAGHTWEDTVRGRGIREFRFCRHDAALPLPGENVLPLLSEFPVAAQEVDPERGGITSNERITFEFIDQADPGPWNPRQQTEGMLANTQIGGGSFFLRFRTIYRNYSNPECYVRRLSGYVEPGGTEAQFQPRKRYVMLNFETKNRKIMLICGDRLKLTRTQIPGKIGNENLSTVALSAGATTMTVTTASEVTAPAANATGASPDYRVVLELEPGTGNSEKVIVTGRNVDTNQLTIQRGRWGTTGKTHAKNVPFREIAEFGTERLDPTGVPLGKNPIDIIVELYRYAGLSTSEIDIATLESERDTWLPSSLDTITGDQDGPLFRRTLTDVAKVEDLVREVSKHIMMPLWVNDAEMVTGRLFRPRMPGETYRSLTDEASFVKGTIETDDNDESRLSRIAIGWEQGAGTDGDKLEDYDQILIHIDIDSEEREFYGDKRQEVLLSKWLQPVDDNPESAANAEFLTTHLLSRFRNGAGLIRGKLELRDDDIQVGEFVKVQTDHIQDAHGNPITAEFQIMKKKRERGRLLIHGLETNILERVFFYAPDAAPDYASATEADKEYGYLSDDQGFVGTPRVPGYVAW